MLAWPLEDAAEERRPSAVVLPKVEGAKGSAGDGLVDGKLDVSDRLRAQHTPSAPSYYCTTNSPSYPECHCCLAAHRILLTRKT